MSVIIQVYFGHEKDRKHRISGPADNSLIYDPVANKPICIPDWPDFESVRDDGSFPITFMGLPLWRPKGLAVYCWAIDYVSCSDTRWVVFGPYMSVVSAKEAIKPLYDYINGYHIISEHCFLGEHKELPHDMWTDG